MPNGLILHCGNALASREQIAAVQTPPSTATWQPVPHSQFLDSVTRQLAEQGYEVLGEAMSLNEDGSRMFGVMEIRTTDQHPVDQPDDYRVVIGLRNAHDRMFALGIIIGTKVLVCDNLSFSAEIKVVRKHTPNILNEMDGKILEAINQLPRAIARQNGRIGMYKMAGLTDDRAARYFIEIVEKGILSPSKITRLWKEWSQPSHTFTRYKSVWTAFNAVTEVLRPPIDPERPGYGKGGVALFDNPRRTIALHRISDDFAGIMDTASAN